MGPLRRAELNGCPWHDTKAMLRQVGLRPTRQRMALGWILFAKGDRHITAEMLYEEATRAKVPVSLATVYNTLHQFTEVGLLRQVAVDGSKTYFDTNATEHHHFFVEGEHALLDIPGADVMVDKMPTAPEATRSPGSTWWCACAARSAEPSRSGGPSLRALSRGRLVPPDWAVINWRLGVTVTATWRIIHAPTCHAGRARRSPLLLRRPRWPHAHRALEDKAGHRHLVLRRT